jgi:hypothetical protein
MRAPLAILLLLAGRAIAASTEDVSWMLPEFPPTFITEKELRGQGYGDGELRYLVEHLAQFHHQIDYGTAISTSLASPPTATCWAVIPTASPMARRSTPSSRTPSARRRLN